jgi:hypothetical protein
MTPILTSWGGMVKVWLIRARLLVMTPILTSQGAMVDQIKIACNNTYSNKLEWNGQSEQDYL